MATEVPTRPEQQPDLGTAVDGIISDVQDLIQSQIQLARMEIEADLRKTRQAASVIAVGLAVTFLGAILLSLMLVYLLHWVSLPAGVEPASLPLWACYALVGFPLTGIGVGVVWTGWKMFASFNPLPDETAKALQETLEWKTKTTNRSANEWPRPGPR